MAMITSSSPEVTALLESMGIDPKKCLGVTIDISPQSVVRADITMLVDKSTLVKLAKLAWKDIEGKDNAE